MVSAMSGLSLDGKTRLALQFIEDMTSVIDDCRRDDAACSRKELARIKQILVLERSAVYEIDDSCSATKRSNEKQEDPERAMHPLLQGLVGRFTEWTTSMIDPQAPKTTHRSDVALFVRKEPHSLISDRQEQKNPFIGLPIRLKNGCGVSGSLR